jgi:hypothetical protein
MYLFGISSMLAFGFAMGLGELTLGDFGDPSSIFYSVSLSFSDSPPSNWYSSSSSLRSFFF